ncbi:2'-5' RNA ligase family protein, partial [Mycolicibacterium elephantis]
MVHSVELVFDPATEAVIRDIWDALRDAGIPSQAPASRPHATLTVAER